MKQFRQLKLKWSRRKLGEYLGVSWRTIEGYEQGRPIPKPVEKRFNDLRSRTK